MVIVGGQEEQDAEIVGSGHVSLVPGVPRHPPWLGVPKDRVMPPPPWARVDGVYEPENIFQIV